MPELPKSMGRRDRTVSRGMVGHGAPRKNPPGQHPVATVNPLPHPKIFAARKALAKRKPAPLSSVLAQAVASRRWHAENLQRSDHFRDATKKVSDKPNGEPTHPADNA